MNKLTNWIRNLFRKWLGIDVVIINTMQHAIEIKALEHRLDLALEMHVDVNNTRWSMSRVVLIGRLKGRDYVRVIDARLEDFDSLERMLNDYSKTHRLGRVDMPLGFPPFKKKIP